MLGTDGEAQTHKGQFPMDSYTQMHQFLLTYIHQLCLNTGCYLEDLPSAMTDMETKESMLSACPDDDDSYLNNYLFLFIVYLQQCLH